MKKLLITLSVFVLMFIGIQTSWAYNSYIMLVDGKYDGNNTVNVTVSDYSYLSDYNIFYQLGSGTWTSWTIGTTILGTGGQILSFGLDSKTDGNADPEKFSYNISDATLTFSSQISPSLSENPMVSTDYYRNVDILWKNAGLFKLTIASTDFVNDGFTAVPIPGSLLLLGSGVFGLVMLRGRKRHLLA
jgi:hypothetical protein